MVLYEIGITEINTQVRRLGYASAILSILNDKTLSELLLYERLEKWSLEHATELNNYVNPQGKIQPTRQKTSAKRYTELVISLGLVGRIAGACRVTRFGRAMLPFLSKNNNNAFELNLAEKCFYLYWLFSKDRDRTLTILNMLQESPAKKLNLLQKNFKYRYIDYLDMVLHRADSRMAHEILTVRNRVAHTWKNPERYAENIVPPRVNWLLDIGLVSIQARGKLVGLTNQGKELVKIISKNNNEQLIYVDQQWLYKNFFSHIKKCFFHQEIDLWQNISNKEKIEYIDSCVLSAFQLLRSSPTPKLSLYPTLIYICLNLATQKNFWVDLEELRIQLEHLSKESNPQYEVRFSHRENESYVILNKF